MRAATVQNGHRERPAREVSPVRSSRALDPGRTGQLGGVEDVNRIGRVQIPQWHFGLGRELGFAFWAMFFVEAAFSAYWSIWPLYIASLGASVPVVGFIVGASGIIRLVIMPPSAAIADRLGSRIVLVGARTIAFAGYFFAVFAQDWRMLLPVVAALGVGEIAFPQIQAHVAGQAKGDTTRIFALIFVVGPGVALGLGPLVAGAVIGEFGLRGAIFTTAMFTLASVGCFAALRNLPAAPRPLAWLARRRVARTTTTADSAAVEPVATSSYRQALSDSRLRRIVILHAATILSLGIGISLLPYYLENVRGIPEARIAQYAALQAIGTVSFGFAVSRSRWMQQNQFLGAALAVALTIAGFAIFTQTAWTPLLIVAFILRGCVFSAWTLFSSAMGAQARPADRSRGFALIELLGGTAFSTAPILAGFIYEIGPRVPLVIAIVMGGLMIPVLAASQRQAHREPPRDDEDPLAVAPATP
jgi:MFS family permease